MRDDTAAAGAPASRRIRWAAYAVHLLTASGAVVGVLTAAAIYAADYRRAFLLMIVAVLLDVIDGPLARLVHVQRVCPGIDGRRLDDIVDYLNYTFLPVLLLGHAGWLPEPVWGWVALPLVTSLFGFAHVGAKQESAGFFRGFPSYWNVVVLYIAVGIHAWGPAVVASLVAGLSLLTVLPVRFVYPNRPPCWMPLFLGGGIFWLGTLLVLVYQYPAVSGIWVAVSLVYPALYIMLSVYLDWRDRRGARAATEDPRQN